jgi:sigma-B regulation protein RsbU (phosphoserine phosphatase)
MEIDEHRHFVALADVAGKALPAALLAVKLQATLRALAPRIEDLGNLGAELNKILCRDGLPSRFASLAYFELRPDSGRVRVLIAGHLPPYLMRHESVTPLERGSMVLGLVPEVTFSEQVLNLAVGETLVIYSDGVTEAMNESGRFFDDHRLIAALQSSKGEPAEVIGTRVLEALSAFVGEAVPNDDVSLIVLRRTDLPRQP